MNQITYIETHLVKLNGKEVGAIKRALNKGPGNATGYRYHPKGDKTGGDFFPTLDACKRSLEDDAPAPLVSIHDPRFSSMPHFANLV